MTNWSEFKPSSAKEMAQGFIDRVKELIGSEWKKIKDELSAYLTNMSKIIFQTSAGIESGQIPRAHADLAIHAQEVAFNQYLMMQSFLAYELASKVVDAVFDLAVTAIRNLTGITVFKT